MTIEEFNNTRFGFGIKAIYDGKVYDIESIDFQEAIFGLNNGTVECSKCGHEFIDILWVRCENCEIMED